MILVMFLIMLFGIVGNASIIIIILFHLRARVKIDLVEGEKIFEGGGERSRFRPSGGGRGRGLS